MFKNNYLSIFVIAVFAISSISRADSIREIDASSLAHLLEKAVLDDELFSNAKEAAKAGINEQLDNSFIPINVSENELNQALSLFKKAFYLSKSFDNAEIEYDSFLLPNSDLATIHTTWTSITDNKNRELLKAKEKASFSKDQQIRINIIDDDDSLLVNAKGKVTISLPTQYLRFKLTQENLGKPVTQGDYKITLLALDRNIYQVLIQNIQGKSLHDIDIAIMAMSRNGRLSFVETKMGPDPQQANQTIQALISDLKSGKKTSKQVISEMQSLQKKWQDTTLYTQQVHGLIQEVQILIPQTIAERTFNIVAVAKPDVNFEEPKPVNSVRYKNSVKPIFSSLSEAELKKIVSCRSARNSALFQFNQLEVECSIPKLANSSYATFTFDDIKLINNSKQNLAIESSTVIQEATLRLSLEDSNSNQPISESTNIQGKLRIKYPLAITANIITKTDAIESMYIEHNLFMFANYDLNEIDTFNIPFMPIRGFDTTGRELVRLPDFHSFSNDDDGTEMNTIAFWGNLNKVEVDTVQNWAEFTILVNLKAAPLLKTNKD